MQLSWSLQATINEHMMKAAIINIWVNVLMYEKWDTILAKPQVSFAITWCLSPFV